MAEPPQVSVVIPTRDRARLLPLALRSALGQQNVDVEVIVVDDGSLDETPALLAGIDDARLRVLRHDTSTGVARARNDGVAAAHGEWVAFLDDDDVWAPGKLRAQLDAAAAVGADFAYASAITMDEERTPTMVGLAPDPDKIAWLLLRHNIIPGGCSNVIVRTELVRRVGGFDETLHQVADWDLWIRLSGGGTAARCEDILIGYLEHRSNMLVVDPGGLFRELTYLSEKHFGTRSIKRAGWYMPWLWLYLSSAYLRAGRPRRAALAHLRYAVAERRAPDVARGVLMLLGDRAEGTARGLKRALFGIRPAAHVPRPEWLTLYQTSEPGGHGRPNR